MPEAPSFRKDPFFTLFIKHLPTSEMVSFEGWVTDFSDKFSSTWNSQNVYGRMDPLVTFENTQRTISLGFDIVSDNQEQAISNLINVNRLIEFLYPIYSSAPGYGTNQTVRGSQTTLKAAPLLGMRWTNLISNPTGEDFLYGYINGGLDYTPDMSEGGFIIRKGSREIQSSILADAGQSFAAGLANPIFGEATAAFLAAQDPKFNSKITKDNSYIPKKLSISFTFGVLHTHLNGWDQNKKFGGSAGLTNRFPNASIVRVTDEATTVGTFGEQTSTFEHSREALILEND